jgi:hypothetical protein
MFDSSQLLVVLFVILLYMLLIDKHFASCGEFHRAVENSRDYFTSMTPMDLSFRSSSSADEYIAKYKAAYVPFSATEEAYLRNIAAVLRDILPKKLACIRYKFAKIKYNHTIENGYPHTIDNLIVLNDNFYKKYDERGRYCTIAHEIIHVYQRNNPQDTDGFLATMGFFKVSGADPSFFHNNLLPDPVANPDCRLNTDYFILDGNKRKLVRTIYAGTTYGGDVKNITIDMKDRSIGSLQVHDGVKYEGQPNEVMAETIAKTIFEPSSVSQHWRNVATYWLLV